jgi:hypothetical protein
VSDAKQPLTASDAILSGLVPGKKPVMISRCFLSHFVDNGFSFEFFLRRWACVRQIVLALLHETVLTWF